MINPIALKLYSRARQAAVEADKKRAGGKAGKLCGLPITIKDSQFLAGYPCANGSHLLSDFIPTETCRAIELLEQEGAIIFAKTTCPEFSLTGVTHSELYGLTSNPWNVERTCGGSSGGAGVVVASGIGAFSLGGDGGGSIRIPAGFCGIVGFKPSFGAIPREGQRRRPYQVAQPDCRLAAKSFGCRAGHLEVHHLGQLQQPVTQAFAFAAEDDYARLQPSHQFVDVRLQRTEMAVRARITQGPGQTR